MRVYHVLGPEKALVSIRRRGFHYDGITAQGIKVDKNMSAHAWHPVHTQ